MPTGTARVTTLGELDEAMKSARASKSGAYIEIIGGKMDMPPALAYAHGRLKTMYGDTPLMASAPEDKGARPCGDRASSPRLRRPWRDPRLLVDRCRQRSSGHGLWDPVGWRGGRSTARTSPSSWH